MYNWCSRLCFLTLIFDGLWHIYLSIYWSATKLLHGNTLVNNGCNTVAANIYPFIFLPYFYSAVSQPLNYGHCAVSLISRLGRSKLKKKYYASTYKRVHLSYVSNNINLKTSVNSCAKLVSSLPITGSLLSVSADRLLRVSALPML